MFLSGIRRKLTALVLCKSIEFAIQWFKIHHRITFATIQNPAVYLSGARVSIFSTLVPQLHTHGSPQLGVYKTAPTHMRHHKMTLKHNKACWLLFKETKSATMNIFRIFF